MDNREKLVKTTHKHIFYFDYLRIVAIVAVVILHVAAQNIYTTEITSSAWNIFNICDSLVRWGVPVFVMISGALFLSMKRPIQIIYKKNITKLLIILILWTLIDTIWQFSIINNHFSFKEFVVSLMTGPYYLWFLYMLIGLYMLIPVLKKIAENKRLSQYYLLLSFIFAFLVPELTEIIALNSETVANLIIDKIDKTKMFMVLGYTGYFILGHYLNKNTINRKTELIMYFFGIVGAIFTILITSLSSNLKGEINVSFYNNITINVAAMSIAVFVFFKNHLNHEPHKSRYVRLLRLLSRCSLGVYLMHVIILNSLNSIFGINTLTLNPMISVPLLSLIIIIISYPLSILLYKIPYLGKWIV